MPTGGTQNLMTGIAWVESSYNQFEAPGPPWYNDDLWSLDTMYTVTPYWPTENKYSAKPKPHYRGNNIGLMQVDMTTVSTPDLDAWNWSQNCIDGEALFRAKLKQAIAYRNGYMSGYTYTPTAGPNKGTQMYYPPLANLPPLGEKVLTAWGGHADTQLEDMALAMYSGNAPLGTVSPLTLQSQYWVPYCSSSGPDPFSAAPAGSPAKVCATGWQWRVNGKSVPYKKGTSFYYAYGDSRDYITLIMDSLK